MSQKRRNDYCIVPKCTSTRVSTPNKLFFTVPSNEKVRKLWFQKCRRDSLSPKTHSKVCEDHFNWPDDLANYYEHTLCGRKPVLKKNAYPSKFECQGVNESKSRQNTEARIRRATIKKMLESESENNNKQLALTQLVASAQNNIPRVTISPVVVSLSGDWYPSPSKKSKRGDVYKELGRKKNLRLTAVPSLHLPMRTEEDQYTSKSTERAVRQVPKILQAEPLDIGEVGVPNMIHPVSLSLLRASQENPLTSTLTLSSKHQLSRRCSLKKSRTPIVTKAPSLEHQYAKSSLSSSKESTREEKVSKATILEHQYTKPFIPCLKHQKKGKRKKAPSLKKSSLRRKVEQVYIQDSTVKVTDSNLLQVQSESIFLVEPFSPNSKDESKEPQTEQILETTLYANLELTGVQDTPVSPYLKEISIKGEPLEYLDLEEPVKDDQELLHPMANVKEEMNIKEEMDFVDEELIGTNEFLLCQD